MQTMQLCLDDANMNKNQVDAIHVHGTGTQHNDAVEAIALEGFFEDEIASLPILANKALVGHSLGAAGAIQTAFSIIALNHNLWATLPNLKNPIRPWNFANHLGTSNIKTLLNNSFGFGSNNACLLLESK